LAHPLRLEILRLLNRHEASPNEIAAELGEPLGNVSYHVRMLHKLDCVELVRTVPRRGAVEHYYRGKRRTRFTRGEWQGLPGEARRAMNDVILRTIWSELHESMDSGVFNTRAESQVSRLALTLDERGWEQLSGLLADLEDSVAELERESAERLADSGEEAVTARCALMQFEAAPAEAMRPGRLTTRGQVARQRSVRPSG
jgi:DNA-binding transcriptional ArsR family regulator